MLKTSFTRKDALGSVRIHSELGSHKMDRIGMQLEGLLGLLASVKLAVVGLFLVVCSASISMLNAQTDPSANQRMEAVQSHLSRYVVLGGSGGGELRLASQMTALHVPAVSMAAIRNGRIDWAQAYGVTSLDGAPVTTTTLFGAASIAKPVTAMGVLKLVEEHRIDLDADVNRYLKRWKIPDNQFTA